MAAGGGEGPPATRSWREKATEAPGGAGVYIMRGAGGEVLYVGKAKSLRARLRTYLDPQRQGPKTAAMTGQVAGLEYIVTDSELEALILENSLIKKWKPKYNITLRDDKTYPFLRLSANEEFPTLTVVRRPAEDGARYFGPYVPAGAMRRTLKMLERIYPLRRCRGSLEGKKRPCLNFQMGRCLAPCVGKADPEAYHRMVEEVALFLRGGGRELSSALRRRMGELARQERYEEAALLRDRVKAIDATLERQKMHLPDRGDMDVVGTARLGPRRSFVVLQAKGGRIVGARTSLLDDPLEERDDAEALELFLRARYDRDAEVPPELLLPCEPSNVSALVEWLGRERGGKAVLRVPRSGPLRSLVAMASRNALGLLEEKGRGAAEAAAALEELGRAAGREGTLRSLAAVDVSTISGTDAVASLVWWEGGSFSRGRYRRFKLRSPGGPDDFLMMAEAVGRLAGRVDRGDWPPPDVLMLDGGRGQLSAGASALARHRWRPALLVAIAKPREGRGTDALYVEGRRAPLEIAGGSALMMLLQSVRDEAHRSALRYHRRLRGMRGKRSLLDGVPGLGSERKKVVLRHFGSVTRLRDATLEELTAVQGLPATVARALFDHLRR